MNIEEEIKKYGKKYRQEIEELERKINIIIKELYHKANIEIIIDEEKEDDKRKK